MGGDTVTPSNCSYRCSTLPVRDRCLDYVHACRQRELPFRRTRTPTTHTHTHTYTPPVHTRAYSVVQAALNVGTSVEQIGLYGCESERLWVRTGTESLHLWEWRVATMSDAEGGHGAFAEWGEARGAAAAAAAAGGSVASLFEDVYYLAGCHYDAGSCRLMLLAGNDGVVGAFPLEEQPGPGPGLPLAGAVMQPPDMALSGGHTEVRGVSCAHRGPGLPLAGVVMQPLAMAMPGGRTEVAGVCPGHGRVGQSLAGAVMQPQAMVLSGHHVSGSPQGVYHALRGG